MTRAARRWRDDPEHRPSPAQQVAGLALFAPLPVDTRRAAHAAIEAEASALRARCLDALARHGDLTADECATILGESVLAIRPRMSELRKTGLIEDTGTRRPNLSGHSATVWRRAHADPA